MKIGFAECCLWDALISANHYLLCRDLFGKSPCHIACVDCEWLSLVGLMAHGVLSLSREQLPIRDSKTISDGAIIQVYATMRA